MIGVFTCFVVVTGTIATELKIEESLEVLLALHARIQDAEFVAEVDEEILEVGEWKRLRHYDQRVRYQHENGVFFIDEQIDDERGISKKSYSTRVGGEARYRHKPPNPRAEAIVGHEKANNVNLTYMAHLPTYVWRIPYFRFLPKDEVAKFDSIGSELVDGLECFKFDYLANDRRSRFWLSPSRGGNMVKTELFDGPKLQLFERVYIGRFAEITDQGGVSHWFPVEAIKEVFWKPAKTGSVYLSSPERRYLFRIPSVSIKLNRGLKLDDVEIQFTKNERNRDFDQERQNVIATKLNSPNVSISEARELLEHADTELSKLERPTSWKYFDPFSIVAAVAGLLGLIGLMIAWYLKRR